MDSQKHAKWHTSDLCPDQTECVDVKQQLNKQPGLWSVLTYPSAQLLTAILFGSNRRSSQATTMSAVSDLPPALCRPLICEGVALATTTFFGPHAVWQSWVQLTVIITFDYWNNTVKYYLIERNWQRLVQEGTWLVESVPTTLSLRENTSHKCCIWCRKIQIRYPETFWRGWLMECSQFAPQLVKRWDSKGFWW